MDEMRPLRTLPSSLCKAYISSCDLNDNDLMSDNWHRVSNDLSSAEQSGDNLIQQNAPTMLSSSPSSLNDDEGAVHRKWRRLYFLSLNAKGCSEPPILRYHVLSQECELSDEEPMRKGQ